MENNFILIVEGFGNCLKRRVITEINLEFIDSDLKLDCRAVWDTGATNSYVLPKLLNNHKLVKCGKVKVKGRRNKEFNQYRTNLYLSNIGKGICLKNFLITEYDLKWEEEVIIGMDIIKLGRFFIDNDKNRTHFGFFLSMETIDQINNGNIPCCSFKIEINNK